MANRRRLRDRQPREQRDRSAFQSNRSYSKLKSSKFIRWFSVQTSSRLGAGWRICRVIYPPYYRRSLEAVSKPQRRAARMQEFPDYCPMALACVAITRHSVPNFLYTLVTRASPPTC
jgi:hypothetical protein